MSSRLSLFARLALIPIGATVLFLLVRPSNAGEISGPPKKWDKMSHDEKKAYMKQSVLPTMKVIFQQFDPDDFANMKCETCHGSGAKKDKYDMPNPNLPKLPSTEAAWKPFRAKHGEMMKFMETKVRPTMAKLLGEPEFNPKTGKGFKCTDCHTEQK